MLVEPQPRRVKTTDSQHGRRCLPNLLKDIKISRPNQIRVADITYLRWQSDCVYLAILMDQFSRAIRGWNLGWALGESLALLPIKQAPEEKSDAEKPPLGPWRAVRRKGLCEAP